MRLRFLVPLAGALACSTNPSVFPGGDFSGPSGLAIAPVGDRDFLFVANQGANELRAIILCNSAPGASTTCPSNQDGQFLPGPIRVFPASIIDVGERPLRLAGARLVDANSTLHGAVLVAGLDAVLRVVDAANLFAASENPENQGIAKPPTHDVTLPAAAVDVVATSVQGPTVSAVVATQAPPGGSAALTVVSVSLDPTTGLARAAATQQCTNDFVPTRLALIPGETVGVGDARPAHVYVADGTPVGTPGGVGDGAVEFSVPAIPAIAPGSSTTACTVFRRLPASDPADSPRRARALRSLALSPAAIDKAGDTPLPAGQLLIGVTAPDPALCAAGGVRACDPSIAGPGVVCADQGFPNCGGGRVVLLSNDPATGQSALLRAPASATGAPMQPLLPPTPAREVAFLGRPTCPTPPCTGVRIGFNTSVSPQVFHEAIVGLTSTEDGSLTFIDVQNLRFFDDTRDTVGAPVTPSFIAPVLSPAPSAGQAATQLNLAPPAAAPGTQIAGWFNAGVSRNATFKVVWHAALPGLDSVGGILSRSGTGPIQLTVPSKDLTPWITSPELRLGPGDFVRSLSFTTTAGCGDLVTTFSSPDIPIVAVLPHEIDLQAVPGFDPDPSCFASGNVGGTFEVHAGSTAAGGWAVVEDSNVLARLPHGGQLVLTGPRFDYPVDPDSTLGAANTFAFSFSITGPQPLVTGTAFIGANSAGFQTFDGRVVSSVRDLSSFGTPGFAGPILVYDSVRYPNDQIVFTAITGSNSVMRSIPAQLGVPNANPASFFMFY